MRIVLDTNVLVSGLLKTNGPPASILNLLVTQEIVLLYDNRIVQEYTEVLRREKFVFKTEWIDELISFIQHEGHYISAAPTQKVFHDDYTCVFYEVAKSGGADYLVTGNLNHFPKDNRIKSPRDSIVEGMEEPVDDLETKLEW